MTKPPSMKLRKITRRSLATSCLDASVQSMASLYLSKSLDGGEVENKNDMRNRKACFAMVFQAMCDSKLRFRWLGCALTGNSNDSIAWECSKLHHKLQETPLPHRLWIAGDDAYKASGTVVTPYPGARLHVYHRSFNYYHSRMRMTIERSFGVWKERWGVFHRPSCISLRLLGPMVRATMILHNMIITDNDTLPAASFTGTSREMSDMWPGDDPEVILNEMTPAELRNLYSVPQAQREWMCEMLEEKGIIAPDHSSVAVH